MSQIETDVQAKQNEVTEMMCELRAEKSKLLDSERVIAEVKGMLKQPRPSTSDTSDLQDEYDQTKRAKEIQESNGMTGNLYDQPPQGCIKN